MSGTGWRTQAACRSVDPDTFFPTASEGPTYVAQVAVAKAICAGCPVVAECLAEALVRIPYGIAGGLTPEERRGRRGRVGVATAAVVEAGMQPHARRAEVEAAGWVLLTAGRPISEVAERCGVSERTATRWAARVRAHQQAEGSHGCNRAPLLISHSNTQAGTAMEGARS